MRSRTGLGFGIAANRTTVAHRSCASYMSKCYARARTSSNKALGGIRVIFPRSDGRATGQHRLGVALGLWMATVIAVSGCGLAGPTSGSAASGKVEVVAAENFWGSIATQLGGDHAHVTSVISNPDTDPH